MRLRRILIANRGEVVERIARTCRRLGIETVAIFSDADADARFVGVTDAAVRIGGAAPSESYLVAERIIEAARAAGADAVHPGYGFLAENADFAHRCREAGLVFIGPSPEAIRTMGDKVEAKAVAAAAGVPLLPMVNLGADEEPDAAAIAELGLPAIVKASAGGGGKGMHVVEDPAALAATIARARREAGSAFGDDRVFVERYVVGARHIEVQVFGDSAGTMAVLHERECTIQRRHQKVVEEAPSPAIDAGLRAELATAARALSEAIAYVGAGTVEFLLAGDGRFYFLEMNTRLQVEHAVTEEVTGLDLVELQIRVAEGEPLPAAALEAPIHGHAVEVRLYAEDPTRGFAPDAGRLERFEISGEELRIEAGVASGETVTTHYDPMLAKVIAHAPTRAEAVDRLAARLAESQVYGVATNRDLLVRILRDPAYREARIDTGFLDGEAMAALAAPLAGAEQEGEHAIAVVLAGQAERRAGAGALPGLPPGWRNNYSAPQTETVAGAGREWVVSYREDRSGIRASAQADGVEVSALTTPGRVGTDLVELELGGIRRRFAVLRRGARAWATGHGASSSLTLLPRLPEAALEQSGSLTASMPGLVLRVHATAGDEVAAGDPVATLEAMKMEIEVVAPESGTIVRMGVVPGDQIEAGRVIAVVDSAAAEAPGSNGNQQREG